MAKDYRMVLSKQSLGCGGIRWIPQRELVTRHKNAVTNRRSDDITGNQQYLLTTLTVVIVHFTAASILYSIRWFNG